MKHTIRQLSWRGILLTLLGCAAHGQVCKATSGSDLQLLVNQCSQSGTHAASILVEPNAVIIPTDGTVSLPSNIEIRCAVGSVIKETRLTDIFLISGASNILISGCTFEGQAVGVAAIRIKNGTNIHISSIAAGGFPGDRYMPGAIITGQGWHAVEIDHSIFGLSGPRCTPALCGWYSGNHGAIELLGQNEVSDHIRIHDNVCKGNISHSSCFKLEASTRSQNKWIEILDNDVTVGAFCKDSRSVGCLGIELFEADDLPNGRSASDAANLHFVVGNNRVRAENNSGGNNAFCISLGGARYGSVVGNRVQDCKAYGIETIASFAQVQANRLTDAGPISWDANTLSHTDIVISDNVITRPSCRAIHFIASKRNSLEGATVTGNIITGPFGPCSDGSSPAALRLQSEGANMRRIDVLNNKIQNIPLHSSGIETAGGDAVTIRGNRFLENHGTGISLGYAGSGTNFSVTENRCFGSGVFIMDHKKAAVIRRQFNSVNGMLE